MGNPDSATHLAVSEASPSSSHLVAPRAGDRIGRYVVERMIGSGGMGYVVAARHEQLGELAAVKLLHPRGNKDRVQVERFVREARAMAKIKSEHVVRVLDVGRHETTGAPFIVMEHLDGRDLGQILRTTCPTRASATRRRPGRTSARRRPPESCCSRPRPVLIATSDAA